MPPVDGNEYGRGWGRGASVLKRCARASLFLSDRLGFWLGVLQSVGAVPSAERDSERAAHSELSWVLNRAALRPDDGNARRLGSAEGSLEKFSQMTHFSRTEFLDGNIDLGGPHSGFRPHRY